MMSGKPWKADAVLRLMLSMLACLFTGSLLASVLHYAGAGGKVSARWFYPAAAVGFGCLASSLVLLSRPWQLENVMRRLLVTMSCLYAGFLIVGWVQTSVGPAEPSTRNTLLSLFCFQGAALILVTFFLREHATTWSEAFGLDCRPGHALLVGIAAASLFLPVGWGLQQTCALILEHLPRLALKPEEQQAVQVIRDAVSWPARAALGIGTILLAPAAEELLFRGILYSWIKQGGLPRLALWGTSLAFAAIHMNLISFVPLLVLALLLTMLYERTGNLLAPIAAHGVFNALNFVALNLQR